MKKNEVQKNERLCEREMHRVIMLDIRWSNSNFNTITINLSV